MTKTAAGLVAFAIAHLGWPYMYGNNGSVITEALIQQKAIQYPKMYTATYIQKLRADIGKRGIDCSGLVDIYLGVDLNAAGYYAKANPRGNIGSIPPSVAGVLVFKSDRDGDIYHVGICEDDGHVIEARGIDYDVIRSHLAGGGWDLWGYCHLIDYTGTEEDKTVLYYGDENENVRALQRALIALGYDLGEFMDENSQPTGADADYGELTAAAVADFEIKHGLDGNGSNVDLATLAAILKALSARPVGTGITQAELDAAKNEAGLARLGEASAQSLAALANSKLDELLPAIAVIAKYSKGVTQ